MAALVRAALDPGSRSLRSLVRDDGLRRRRGSALCMRRRGQLQENPVLAQDEAFLAGEAVVLLAERVGGEAGAVGLVGGQALDRVDAVGGGGRALVRREVADELGAAARDRLAPVA